MAILQHWNDIDQVLGQPEVTPDPSVIESFHARTAHERNASLDAELHWNHAISLAGTDPFKLRFVANYAEQSHATAAALKAYEQLARFPSRPFSRIAEFSEWGKRAATPRPSAQRWQTFLHALRKIRTPPTSLLI